MYLVKLWIVKKYLRLTLKKAIRRSKVFQLYNDKDKIVRKKTKKGESECEYRHIQYFEKNVSIWWHRNIERMYRSYFLVSNCEYKVPGHLEGLDREPYLKNTIQGHGYVI